MQVTPETVLTQVREDGWATVEAARSQVARASLQHLRPSCRSEGLERNKVQGSSLSTPLLATTVVCGAAPRVAADARR